MNTGYVAKTLGNMLALAVLICPSLLIFLSKTSLVSRTVLPSDRSTVSPKPARDLSLHLALQVSSPLVPLLGMIVPVLVLLVPVVARGCVTMVAASLAIVPSTFLVSVSAT